MITLITTKYRKRMLCFLLLCSSMMPLFSCALVSNPTAIFDTQFELSRFIVAFNSRESAISGYSIGIGTMDSLDGLLQLPSSPLPRPKRYLHAAKPALIYGGEQYFLFYGGFTGQTWEIAQYRSFDGIRWQESGNPILTSGPSGTWDDLEVNRPVVTYDSDDPGREYKLWYRGYNGNAWGIGYAFSSDGFHFTKYAGNPLASTGDPSKYDGTNLSPEAIFKDESTYYLFYQAAESKERIQGAVLTFTNPEGPYHKYTENPILRVRPEATQKLLGTSGIGQHLLLVDNALVFELNEPVMISSDNQQKWEVNRVVGIPNQQTILLETPLIQEYAIEENPFIDSILRRKVYPTYVWKENETWFIFVTAFQPRSDNGVREFTARASGSNLDALQWDYAHSPVHRSANSLDHTYFRESLENLSVVEVQANVPVPRH